MFDDTARVLGIGSRGFSQRGYVLGIKIQTMIDKNYFSNFKYQRYNHINLIYLIITIEIRIHYNRKI